MRIGYHSQRSDNENLIKESGVIMTLKELKVLSELLSRFSSEFYSYNPPFELSGVVNIVLDAIEEEKNRKSNR